MLDRMAVKPQMVPLNNPKVVIPPREVEETPEETEQRVIGVTPATVSFNKFNI